MKKNILMLSFCTFAFFSCTNEEELVNMSNTSKQQINLSGVNIENKNGTLVFENEEQLNNVLGNIYSLEYLTYHF
ncbi:MAG: hypothetical protein LBG96_13865 [Tannerella sp.]|jgi:hypothetical protein|nr:hypothetical protein [Tannerella sp.]